MNREPRSSPPAIVSWCLYDFANSAFTTLVVTFVYATFFTEKMAADRVSGTALWSRGVTITAIAVALLSPVLGAVADRGGFRKRFLLLATIVCVVGTVALYFPNPGQATLALVWFVIANIAFEMANVFYNAFLPDVAPPGRIGRISGYGWALGYGGGLVALVVALFCLVKPDPPWFGLDTGSFQHVRATTLLVAVWYALFSIPMFLWVREDRSRVSPKGERIVRAAARQLVATFHEIRRYRQIVRFLVARLVFNDGLITIFAFGGIYAAGTFDFSPEKLIVFGIVLNVAAGAGAFAMGFLDDFLGGRKTILITLVALTLAATVALLAPSEAVFWAAACLVGVFAGPNQAASRSLMGRFVPPDKENEFFGFFAFSGKATAFLGPMLLGLLTTAFESQRAGLSVVVVFFVLGGAILLTVNEREGVEAANREE
ncbi:MAG: MFS transporter [Planctomycetota bacterium]